MFETGISVACEVTVGTFMSEYSVRIADEDRILWEGLVDKEMVIELVGTPETEKYLKGRIYAYLISYDQQNAIIELPVENLGEGRRVCVPLGLLRKEKIPA